MKQGGVKSFSRVNQQSRFAQRKRTVRKPVGERFNDRYTQATVKYLPSVMIRGLCPVMAQLVFSFYQPKQQ